MNVVIALLVFGLVFVLALVAALVALAVHIHGEERRMSLAHEPRTRAGAVARRVLSASSVPRANVRRSRAHARRW